MSSTIKKTKGRPVAAGKVRPKRAEAAVHQHVVRSRVEDDGTVSIFVQKPGELREEALRLFREGVGPLSIHVRLRVPMKRIKEWLRGIGEDVSEYDRHGAETYGIGGYWYG